MWRENRMSVWLSFDGAEQWPIDNKSVCQQAVFVCVGMDMGMG